MRPLLCGYSAALTCPRSHHFSFSSAGAVKALAHRVVATEQTKDNGCHAIVCFVRLTDVPVYDKRMHRRLQEMPAGFNYDMSHAEFAKLFKSI